MFKALSSFCQFLIDALAFVLKSVCALFPPSPFTVIEHSGFGELIAKINYFLPIYEFVSIAEAWLIAVTVWYVIVIVARWVKAVE